MARSEANWISFAGVESGDVGARVTRLPDIPTAAARGQAVEIPGRDGALWLSDDAFREVALTVELELGTDADEGRASAWLTGEGELILSDRDDWCWRARVSREVEWKRGVYAGGVRRGAVTFACQPFRYQAGSPAMAPITQPKVFSGRGNWPAKPVITVYGAGDIHLMINDATVLLTGVEDSITLDCEAMMAFRGGENASGRVTMLSEDDRWPALSPGKNRISWTGDVEKVVLRPNWRMR